MVYCSYILLLCCLHVMICGVMNVMLRLRLDGDSFEGSLEVFPEEFEQGSTDQFEGKYNFKHHPITL